MSNTPAKRWRVSYKSGITLDDGSPCFRADVSAPMVLAVEYDSVLEKLRVAVEAMQDVYSRIDPSESETMNAFDEILRVAINAIAPLPPQQERG